MQTFETGPIRPPSEAASILLRLTRNCPWNRCAFCPVYKGEKFSIRRVEEVKGDIDIIAKIAERVTDKLSGGQIRIPTHSLSSAISEIAADKDIPEDAIRQVIAWMRHGMKSLFLQDADSLILKTDWLVDILEYARKRFPSIKRVTSYARAKSVSRKSLAELTAIHAAGLDRIHIGLESGSDRLLELVNKGVKQDEQVRAGKNVIDAGFELSLYYMPGLGGAEFMEDNARESASVLNRVNPTYIRIRSVIPVPGTPLHTMMLNGEWAYPAEIDKVRELREMIAALKGITSVIASDHIMNLIEDAEGVLPDDKDKILSTIDTFLDLPIDDQESFIVGRRIGRYRYVSDFFARRDPDVERIKEELKSNYSTVDEGVLRLLWNYI